MICPSGDHISIIYTVFCLLVTFLQLENRALSKPTVILCPLAYRISRACSRVPNLEQCSPKSISISCNRQLLGIKCSMPRNSPVWIHTSNLLD